MKFDSIFSCWFASNNIHLLFHGDCQCRRDEFCVLKRKKLQFLDKKAFLFSKKFFQNRYKQPWLSCWLLAYALQVLWEVSARWTLLLQAPTCPCWQSVLVPFSTPQVWAVMVVLNIFIGQSLSDHDSTVMKWTGQVKSLQVNSFPLSRFLQTMQLDILLSERVTKNVSVNNLKFIFEENWQLLCQKLWTM